MLDAGVGIRNERGVGCEYRIELFDAFGNIRRIKEVADHRHRIRAGGDHLRCIAMRDAADGNDG